MRAIFLSYRREDAQGEARLLFDHIVGVFGKHSVFMDVETIEVGRDFRKAIDENVGTCGVLLAIIGKNWVDAKSEAGQRRLEAPNDYVRLETASALRRDIPVIPVLVHGTKMPSPEQLPDDLKELAYRNGVELGHAHWDSDVRVLIDALRAHVEDSESDLAARSQAEDFFKGPAEALVIGVSNYKDGAPPGQLHPGQFTNLKCAAQDALDFTNFLESNGMEGHVRCLTDQRATLRNIRTEFGKLRDACDGASGKKPLVFIFFSGHGMSTNRGRGYLIPYDGEQDDLDGTALANDEFQLYVRRVVTDRLVVFLDACHAGVMGVPGTKGAFSPYCLPGIGDVGRCLIASCKPDQDSLEGQRNSIFTQHLLEVLQQGLEDSDDEYVKISKLFAVLEQKVPKTAADQHPGKTQNPHGFNVTPANDFALAVNLWRIKAIQQVKENKQRFVERIALQLRNTDKPPWTMIEQLYRYVETGKAEPGQESFYGLLDDQFENCGYDANDSALERARDLLWSAYKRVLGYVRSPTNKGAAAPSQKAPPKVDPFTPASKPGALTPERLGQPSFQDLRQKRQLSSEDQKYVVEAVESNEDYVRFLTFSLSGPTSEADLEKFIMWVEKKERGEEPEPSDAIKNLLCEVRRRFLEKWPNAAPVKQTSMPF